MADEVTKDTKRPRRMMKVIKGTVVEIEVVGGSGKKEYDFSKLPPKIQASLGPFGLNHKLGDSAAGKSGAEAEKAVQHVWDGLMKGEWTVRAPAAPKIKVSEVTDKYANMTKAQKDAAVKAMKELGISIPGITA